MRSMTIFLPSLALLTGILVTGGTLTPRIPGETGKSVTAALSTAPETSVPRSVHNTLWDCNIASDNCGSLTPSDYSVFIADGSGLTNDGTLFFVDVPSSGDGVFQVDPMTCSVVAGTYYSVSYYGYSERGIAYDPEYNDIWHGGWNEYYIIQNDATPPYEFLSATYAGLAIASMAIDDVNNYLFVGTNDYFDMLYVYDITGGTLGSLLGAWVVPWQAPSDGYDMAGMEFNPAGQLVMINQYGNYSGTNQEVFNFSVETGPVGLWWCDLANTSFGWGIGLVSPHPDPWGYLSYVTDIGDLAAPVDMDLYGFIPSPQDLVCIVTPENDVQLTWTNAAVYEEIRIWRSPGDLIATLPGDATSYLDVRPGVGHYMYGVVGYIAGGDSWDPYPCWVHIFPLGETCFDFNATGGGFTASGTANGWEWGSPSYVFDGNAWEVAVGGYYDANECTWLDSPVIKLGSEGGWVEFDTYDYTECHYDGWTLQISLDGGASFSCIHPLEGYDQAAPYGASSCPQYLGCDSNCGYDSVRHWNYDLTGLPNVSALFRFVFASDSSIQYYGTVMDNFCIHGGTVPSILVQCQLLNADTDGDGIRDVHVGDYMYYSATFINLTGDPVDYGAEHFFYANTACPPEADPVDHFGPACKGTLEANGVATHYYRIMVPNNANIPNFNPFAVEVAAWQCADGNPEMETGRYCFNVILLPGWEPPPVTEPLDSFTVEEMEGPPLQETPR